MGTLSDPLTLLREFARSKRRVVLEGDHAIFDTVRFPRKADTPYRSGVGGKGPFYSVRQQDVQSGAQTARWGRRRSGSDRCRASLAAAGPAWPRTSQRGRARAQRCVSCLLLAASLVCCWSHVCHSAATRLCLRCCLLQRVCAATAIRLLLLLTHTHTREDNPPPHLKALTPIRLSRPGGISLLPP